MACRALIIIDMLNDFVDEKGALYCGPQAAEIVPPIRKRLERFRSREDLVVYLKDSHNEDDLEFERFPKHCVTGTWGSQVVDDLAPIPGEPVVAKKRFSGFFRTDLEKILAAGIVTKVDVVGVCTSICVMDTVGGLASRDYAVRVAQNEVTDVDLDMHRYSLARMEKIYGAEII